VQHRIVAGGIELEDGSASPGTNAGAAALLGGTVEVRRLVYDQTVGAGGVKLFV